MNHVIRFTVMIAVFSLANACFRNGRDDEITDYDIELVQPEPNFEKCPRYIEVLGQPIFEFSTEKKYWINSDGSKIAQNQKDKLWFILIANFKMPIISFDKAPCPQQNTNWNDLNTRMARYTPNKSLRIRTKIERK